MILRVFDEKTLRLVAKRHFKIWSVSRSSQNPAKSPGEGQKAATAASAKPAGIPYSKLTIGIPKEVWPNERR